MTIEEAIKNIQEDGINLGAGDYVDIEALKVAVETMKDYLRIIYLFYKRTETDVEEKFMQTVVYYIAEDGKQFASKNDCMDHNIDLIDWTKFKGIYWVDMNIHRDVNDYGIKETNYNIKVIPFEKLDVGVTMYSRFCKPDYYLYVPNEEMVNVFKSYRNYFYHVDRPFIAKLKPGVNYLAEEGDSLDIKNVGCEVNYSRGYSLGACIKQVRVD